MAEIKDLGTGEIFTGDSVEGIVRRLWGRTCFVKSQEVKGRYYVVKPTRETGRVNVQGEIFIYER